MASNSSSSSNDSSESPKSHHASLVGSLRRKFKGLTLRTTSLSSRIRKESSSRNSYSPPPASISSPFFDSHYRTSSDLSRTSKSLSARSSTLPKLDFRSDDGFKLIEQMYGLPERHDTPPTVTRMPIRTIKPNTTKTRESSPVELPATEMEAPNAVNATNTVTPKSATKKELAEPVRPVVDPVPSVDLFDFLRVQEFDRQYVGDVEAVSGAGADCVPCLTCREYWIEDATHMPPAVDNSVTADTLYGGIMHGIDHPPAGIQTGVEEASTSTTGEEAAESLVVEDEDIEEDEDEDEEMASRLGG